MSEELVFKFMETARSRMLDQLENVSEELADRIPAGFNNNIRWNLGHILTVHEMLIFQLNNEKSGIPGDYVELFKNGSKPADWQQTPPSLEVLKQHLKDQMLKIRETFSGRLDQEAAKPFKEMKTIGEIINFSFYHEGLHTGYIWAMKKTL
ncbi:DinB family protein [Ferviditalea candida]|uniref:DinB family protein n=1 Tax=Ferviditalea candida TaxID=3108399 RepID=A0ABU5ZLX3_9BACL|nr:DinB family protein [Paenibacillaceae bacterium T2]